MGLASHALRTWRHWRDRLLLDPGFQRAALAFPLTRPVARRQAAEVFDLMAGFVYSQVVLACVQSGLLTRLRDEGPQTASALAPLACLPLEACERLLAAAAALQVLEHRGDGRYGLGRRGLPLAADAGLQALVLHHAGVYADLRDPLALLRGQTPPGELARFWPYAQSPDVPVAAAPAGAYSRLMAATQPMVAAQVLAAYPLHRHRRLLDVGGGEGAFAQAAAAHAPQLQVEVFDLPAVAARAEARLAAAGLSARSRVWPGSFLQDELPAGADLISLVRVVHDHDDAAVATLLSAARRALARGGRLLLAEPMAATDSAPAMGEAYFGFYLLAMGQGRPRTPARLRELLQAAGFGRVQALRTALPLVTQGLVAEAT